jgi:hypothetical protein
MTRYRDKDTGRFAGKETWTRSKAQDGTRYVRQYIKPAPPERRPRPAALPRSFEPEGELPTREREREEELEEIEEVEEEMLEEEGGFGNEEGDEY